MTISGKSAFSYSLTFRLIHFVYFCEGEKLMKRIINYSIAFIGVFIVTYLIFCYLPSFRIKLFAPPTEYFVESIKHMVLLKTLVSLVQAY